LFFEMLFRRTPFFAVDRARMNDKILNRPVVVPQRGDGSEVCSMIYGLLEKDPHERFGFEDIMKHPLMADVNFDDVAQKKVAVEEIRANSKGRGVAARGAQSAERLSFQSGDSTIGQTRSAGAFRSSMIARSHRENVKLL
jgi:serine/threonine protein kinase